MIPASSSPRREQFQRQEPFLSKLWHRWHKDRPTDARGLSLQLRFRPQQTAQACKTQKSMSFRGKLKRPRPELCALFVARVKLTVVNESIAKP